MEDSGHGVDWDYKVFLNARSFRSTSLRDPAAGRPSLVSSPTLPNRSPSDNRSINMPSLYQVTVAAALLALGSAVPVERRNQGFSVTQTPKNLGFLTAGPVSMAKTYAKFGAAAPPEVLAAAAVSTGTVVATPSEYDSEYDCPVTIGGQVLQLDFDTGSSDL